jgi:hypothetical protein
MTIEVPKNCRRLVRAYEGQGYTLVQSDHPRHLLKLEIGFSGAPVACPAAPPAIYITMGRSPLSLVSRDPFGVSAGHKIPHYTAAERKHAQFLVFSPRKENLEA